MYKQEGIKPYGQDTEKGEQVERMFDNIAPTYDTLNHRLSWNIDKGWRRKAIKQLAHTVRRISSTLPPARATLPSCSQKCCILKK